MHHGQIMGNEKHKEYVKNTWILRNQREICKSRREI